MSEKLNQDMHKQIYDTPVNMYVYSTYMPKYAMTFGPYVHIHYVDIYIGIYMYTYMVYLLYIFET